MGKSDMPDRWDNFSPFKKLVRGTCILAHKTPLQTSFNRDVTPTELVQAVRSRGLHLKLVIDLSTSENYYCPKEFAHLGVSHAKIHCTHDKIPSSEHVSKFKDIVSNFMLHNAGTRGNHIIGVHCTYGVNSTGYMIARYLIDCLGWSAEDAINEIDLARGHTMERMSLIEDLLNRSKDMSRKRKKLYRSTLSSVGNVCNCYNQSNQSHLEEIMFSS